MVVHRALVRILHKPQPDQLLFASMTTAWDVPVIRSLGREDVKAHNISYGPLVEIVTGAHDGWVVAQSGLDLRHFVRGPERGSHAAQVLLRFARATGDDNNPDGWVEFTPGAAGYQGTGSGDLNQALEECQVPKSTRDFIAYRKPSGHYTRDSETGHWDRADTRPYIPALPRAIPDSDFLAAGAVITRRSDTSSTLTAWLNYLNTNPPGLEPAEQRRATLFTSDELAQAAGYGPASKIVSPHTPTARLIIEQYPLLLWVQDVEDPEPGRWIARSTTAALESAGFTVPEKQADDRADGRGLSALIARQRRGTPPNAFLYNAGASFRPTPDQYNAIKVWIEQPLW